jgi:hypothetical protein
MGAVSIYNARKSYDPPRGNSVHLFDAESGRRIAL